MVYGAFYKTVEGGEGDRCRYPTRMDMYGCGCQHNCAYCYARHLLNFRGHWHPKSPTVADPEAVISVLDTVEPGTILRLGGMTDPFQPLEREKGMTKWLIEELNARRLGYLIVTKSADVADCEVLDPKLAHIQISVTSTGQMPKGFENASPPADRLRAVDSLYERGSDIAIRLSPYIPDLVDPEVIAKSKCDKILMEFLRVNGKIKKLMPWMDFTEYTYFAGGYQHLPIMRKMEMILPFQRMGKQVSVCEDQPNHYKYFQEKVNPNKEDCCNLRL